MSRSDRPNEMISGLLDGFAFCPEGTTLGAGDLAWGFFAGLAFSFAFPPPLLFAFASAFPLVFAFALPFAGRVLFIVGTPYSILVTL